MQRSTRNRRSSVKATVELEKKQREERAATRDKIETEEREMEGVASASNEEPEVSMQGDSDKCPKCSECVVKTDKALQCDLCESWFYIICHNLSEDKYKLLIDSDALHWFCDTCNKHVAKVFTMLARFIHKQDAMLARVVSMETEAVKMAADIESVLTSMSTVETKVKEMYS